MPRVALVILFWLFCSRLLQDGSLPKDNLEPAELIVALGHPDPTHRSRAHEALRRLGPRVEPLLRQSVHDVDPEIAARCNALLTDLAPKVERFFKGKILDYPGGHRIVVNIPGHSDLAPGRSFDILHDSGSGEFVPIARAVYEKSIGTGQVSLLRVVEEVRQGTSLDDVVVTQFTVIGTAPSAPAPKASAPDSNRKPPNGGADKIILLDGGLLGIGLRDRDGVLPGDRLHVFRDDKSVGMLIVTSVHHWGSWARPDGETTMTDLRKGDGIRWMPEK